MQFVAWTKRKDSPGWITDANGCDIWHGGNTGGYGLVRVNGRMCHLNRVRYEREIGPIPPGMHLDHYICNNGAGGCCNPHHCRPVAPRENTLRGNTLAAACAAKTHCPRGHLLAGENLIRSSVAEGKRRCRTCNVAAARAQRARIAGQR